MRLPNQAKPVVRHAGQVEAGVNPSFLGPVGDFFGGGGGGAVVNCGLAIAQCGSDVGCLLQKAPSCIGGLGGLY